MKAMELRLVRLERSGCAGWEAYRHLPLAEWPDAALLAFLELPADASDANLLRIVAEAGA
jgi:hypothetical protein